MKVLLIAFATIALVSGQEIEEVDFLSDLEAFVSPSDKKLVDSCFDKMMNKSEFIPMLACSMENARKWGLNLSHPESKHPDMNFCCYNWDVVPTCVTMRVYRICSFDEHNALRRVIYESHQNLTQTRCKNYPPRTNKCKPPATIAPPTPTFGPAANECTVHDR